VIRYEPRENGIGSAAAESLEYARRVAERPRPGRALGEVQYPPTELWRK
jgi:hypothetical protein